MTTDNDLTTRDRIDKTLNAFEKRDAAAAASMYAENGVFIDPHYPEPEYRGREAIRKALEWALTNIVERPGFTVRNIVAEGDTCAVEVDTHHITTDGSEREFPQVFIVEGGIDGIRRWQTYLPFPPE